jgi:hypothetical protein
MVDMHKTTLRRTKVRINFVSERATEEILDNIEFGYRPLEIPADAVTLVTVNEIVQTTARPRSLYEIEVAKRAARMATE